jgi:PKD domain
MAGLVLVLALATVALPSSARADVRFAPALASSASDPGAASDEGVVAGNAAGVVVAAYSQRAGAVTDLYARVKPAGGAAFRAATDLGGGSAGSPAAAVAADGTVTVAWVQLSPCAGSSVWIATAPPGGSFGSAAKVSDNAYSPKLAVAPDGTVVLLYGHDKGSCVHEERAQVRPRAGSPSDVLISDPAYGSVSDAHIGIDANGTATAAFVQSLTAAPYTHVLRVARRPAGGAWTGTNIGQTGNGDSELAVAPDGSAVIADERAIAAGYAVEVRSRDVGGISFGAPQTVTDTSDNHTLSGVAISDGGQAAVTTADEQVTVRPPGTVSFPQAGSVGLPVSAANLLPVFTAQDLVLFDVERPADASDFSLVARVRQGATGAAFGPPQSTGLTSTGTGAASLAPFGANDVAAAWENKPTGAAEFGTGLTLGDGTAPALGQVSAPASGLAGVPLSFGSAPTDDLGIAGVKWTFGDGATAAGAATTHAFPAPGVSTWALEATDLAGNRAGAIGGLTIQPSAAGAAAKLSVRIHRPRRGTRARLLRSLRGTASGPVSRVDVAVVRVLRRPQGAPVATRTRAACSSLGPTGRLSRRLRRATRTGCAATRFLKASRTKSWTLRLRHRLPAGRYVIFARARSASGAKSPVVHTTFTLR